MKTKEGDEIEIDITGGQIRNHTKGECYSLVSFPPFLQELISKGGLKEYVKEKMREEGVS